MPNKGFQAGNRHGKDGRGGKRSRTDAGAPVPTPCSPRARRFRRTRPLSCTPNRAAQVPRIRPFRPFYPLRTRWRPMNPLSPCSHGRLRSPRRRHRHPQRTDAHGTHAQLAPDCAVGQAASAASAAPIEPSTSTAQQPASPVRPLSACHCTHPSNAHAPARSLHRPGRCLQRGDAEVAANAGDADGSASEDAGSMQAAPVPLTTHS